MAKLDAATMVQEASPEAAPATVPLVVTSGPTIEEQLAQLRATIERMAAVPPAPPPGQPALADLPPLPNVAGMVPIQISLKPYLAEYFSQRAAAHGQYLDVHLARVLGEFRAFFDAWQPTDTAPNDKGQGAGTRRA